MKQTVSISIKNCNKIISLAGLFYLSACISSLPRWESEGMQWVALGSGLGMFFLIRWGYAYWPGIFLGTFAWSWTSHAWLAHLEGSSHILACLLMAFTQSVQALVGALVYKRIFPPPDFFNDVKQASSFIVLCSGLVGFVCPLVTLTLSGILGIESWENFQFNLTEAWLAESTGILVMVPTLLVCFQTIEKRSKLRFNPEILVYAVILFFTCVVIREIGMATESFAPLLLILPFLVWAPFRFHIAGGLLTSWIVSTIAIYFWLTGSSPFEFGPKNQSGVLLQSFIWLAFGLSLILSGASRAQKKAQEKLKKSNELLNVIRTVQTQFIVETHPKEVFEYLLDKFIHLTESQFGFLGHVLQDEKGNPYLKSYAITDISWNEDTRSLYEQQANLGMEFYNMDSLFGVAITSGEPVIANDPRNDSRRAGIPSGHPPLNSFLGIPILCGKDVIGMVGIANRMDGYAEDMVDYLEPFVSTCSQLIQATERERMRKETESQLRSVAENIPMLIAHLDSKLRFRFANQSYERWFGLPSEKIIGRKVEELVGHEAFDIIKFYLNKALKGERQEFETFIPYKYGGNRTVHCVYVPDKNANKEIEGIYVYANDVTKLRKVENEVRNQAQKLQGILDHTPAVVYMKDLEGRYLLVNKEYERLLNLKNDEVQGKTAYEIFQKDLADQIVENNRSVLRDLTAQKVEERMIRNGTQKTFLSIQFPIFGENEEAYAICGISTDITEKKAAEIQLEQYKTKLEEMVKERTLKLSVANERLKNEISEHRKTEKRLKESEEYFRVMADSQPALIWACDANGYCNYLNQVWLNFTGRSFQEEKGDGWAQMVHPEDRENCWKVFLTSLKNRETFQIEYRLLRADGEYRWILDSSRPRYLSNGEFAGFIGSCLDITELKNAEQALKASQESLNYALEASGDGLWDWDIQSGQVYFSNRWLESLGYTRGDFPPHVDSWKKLIHPEDMPKVTKRLDEHFQGIAPVYYCRNRLLTKDGEWCWFLDRGKIVKWSENGKPLRMVGTDTNITEIKMYEDVLVTSRQQLRKLNNQMQQVREDEKRRISREIHDQLGQSLTALKLDVTWIKKNLPAPSFGINEKIQSMLSIIENSIYTVRRISSELRPQVLDILGLEEALKWQSNQFKSNTGIKVLLHIEIDSKKIPPELATHLFRIFQEALTNITRHAKATCVNVDLECSEERIYFEVRDNGVGINSEKIECPDSLGLLGIRERALMFDGNVQIEGEEGKGTSVKVSFPLQTIELRAPV